MDVGDPAEGEIRFPGVSLPCVYPNPVEPAGVQWMRVYLCVRVCVRVDRADGWAQGPADWGAAQTLSQMPPGRTGRSFVRRAGREGPGTRSLNAMEHHTHARACGTLGFLFVNTHILQCINIINAHTHTHMQHTNDWWRQE